MKKLQLKNKQFYILTAIAALLPVGLVFNSNVWFDEAYTISLIRHSYSEIIEILKTDMHPPLYFLSLKLFCDVFGYSLIATKLFSVLGYTALIVLGAFTLKKHYGESTSLVFTMAAGAIPMLFYFSCQQRSYSWSVFFVTMCYLQAVLSVKKSDTYHFILMSAAALAAGYNHFFALLAVAIVFAAVNVYIVFKKRELIKKLIIADAITIAGYSVWVLPLLSQAKSAAKEFWLKGVEPLSVVIFVLSLSVIAVFLLKKSNRSFENIFAAVCVLGLQAGGLLGTILIRPFYIGRYSIVIAGVGAVFISFGCKELKGKVKGAVLILIAALLVTNYVSTAAFEYDSSASRFREKIDSVLSKNDSFLYFDSSFGVMSFYYPDNKHYCTFKQDWFSAFDNVKCIEKSQVKELADAKIWIVTENTKKIPRYISKYYNISKYDSFKCDFNTYVIYLANPITKGEKNDGI